jgi:hypothetical protein
LRDLEKYQFEYNAMPFEALQVKYRRKKVIETLAFYNSESVLEIGCGEDSLFNYYLNFKNFVVVEPADNFYRSAQKDSKGDTRVQVLNKTLQSAVMDLKKQSFDMIVLSSLLHEIEDCKEILNAVHEVADEHTLIHINVPNANSFHRLLAIEMGLVNSRFDKSEMQLRMQQSHIFDLNTLTLLVESTGFIVKDKGTFFVKPFTHKQMEVIEKTPLFPANLFDGLYGMSKYLPEYGSEIYLNMMKE